MQVLLSQVHRLRALVLLGRFLDMGRWAVDLALSVGIFPYVLKLLQTTAPDLRQTLVFIWTKILALDKTCQVGQLHLAMEALLLSRVVVLWILPANASHVRMSLLVTDGHMLQFWCWTQSCCWSGLHCFLQPVLHTCMLIRITLVLGMLSTSESLSI